MAIEIGYGQGKMPYAAVIPQSGNTYVYLIKKEQDIKYL
jgi:hypothetical protein